MYFGNELVNVSELLSFSTGDVCTSHKVFLMYFIYFAFDLVRVTVQFFFSVLVFYQFVFVFGFRITNVWDSFKRFSIFHLAVGFRCVLTSIFGVDGMVSRIVITHFKYTHIYSLFGIVDSVCESAESMLLLLLD